MYIYELSHEPRTDLVELYRSTESPPLQPTETVAHEPSFALLGHPDSQTFIPRICAFIS